MLKSKADIAIDPSNRGVEPLDSLEKRGFFMSAVGERYEYFRGTRSGSRDGGRHQTVELAADATL